MPQQFNSFESDQRSEARRLTFARTWVVLLIAVGLVASCAAPHAPPTDTAPIKPVQPTPQSSIKERAPSIEIRRLLMLAEDAMQRDALTEPESDNALTHYRAVLAIDPDNEDAKEGIHQIVEQYLEWALSEIDSMAFAKASLWLERAALANPKAPSIFAVAERLELKRRLARRTIVLPGWVTSSSLLPNHDDALMRAVESFFADIAESVQQHQAKLIIYALSDEEGRWIYQSVNQQMSERLRATLQIDTPARIDLVFTSENTDRKEEEAL
jgi:hypothetical protein